MAAPGLFSKQLQDNERNYSTFARELLGLFLATRHFLMESRRFTAFVDYKPLTFSIAKTSEPWSRRQQRQLSAISEFTTDIQHVSSKDNFVASIMPLWRQTKVQTLTFRLFG